MRFKDKLSFIAFQIILCFKSYHQIIKPKLKIKSNESDGTRNDTEHPDNKKGVTFQAFRGPLGAQIAFTILLATSIDDTVTQYTAHDRGAANAVTALILWANTNPRGGGRWGRGVLPSRKNLQNSI